MPTLPRPNRALAAVWLLLPAGLAAAQPDAVPDTRPPMEEIVGWLDAPLYAARQQALQLLLERRDLTLTELDAWRTRDDLSPEQRLRLDAAALAVFARGPRAALGVRFPPDDRGGVRILDVVQGFASADHLMGDDVILAADDLPMTRQATLRAAILSHAPGEKIKLTIHRGEDVLDVSVPLGSFDDLRGAATPRPNDLVAAWALRQSRQESTQRIRPITPVRPGAEGVETTAEPGSAAWLEVYASGDAPRGLVVGGQPRETAALSPTRLAALDASRAVTLEDPNLGDADLVLQLAILRNERAQTLDDIERIEGLITGPNLDAGGRAMMRRRLEQVREQLGVLEEQIRRVDEARREKP